MDIFFIDKLKEVINEAYEKALSSGCDVLIADNGIIYRVKPDKSKIFVKYIKKPILIPKGTKYYFPGR